MKGGDRGKKRRRRSSSLKEPFLLLLSPVAAASAAAPWQEEPLTPPEPPLAQSVPPRRGAGQGRGGGPRGGRGRGEWAGRKRGGDSDPVANGRCRYKHPTNGTSALIAKSLQRPVSSLGFPTSPAKEGEGGKRECGGAGDNGERERVFYTIPKG